MRNDKYWDISELSRNFARQKFRVGNFRAAQIYSTVFTYNAIYLDWDREYADVFEFRRRRPQLERLQRRPGQLAELELPAYVFPRTRSASIWHIN